MTESLLKQAQDRAAAGDLSAALAQCQSILDVEPGHRDARALCAQLLVKAARHADALPHLQHLALDQPQDVAIQVSLARCWIALGELAQAEKQLQQLVTQHPEAATVHFEFGRLHLRRSNAAAAIAAFRQAIHCNPDYGAAHHNLGNQLFQAGELEAAARHFESAAAFSPQLAEPLCNLAQLRRAQNQNDTAQDLLQQALTREPAHGRSHQILGEVLAGSGQIEAAASHLQQAVAALPRDADALYALGRHLEHQGDDKGAAQHLLAVAKHRPDHGGAHLRLSQLLNRLGFGPRALKHARRAVELNPQHAGAHHVLAQLLETAGEVESAGRHYRKSLQQNPAGEHAAFFLQAQLRRRLADWSEHASTEVEARERVERFLDDADEQSIPPPLTLNLFAIPAELQRQVAQRYGAHKQQLAKRLLGADTLEHGPVSEGRLRIGYLSPDLRDHPVGQLMQDVFAAHDRDCVEVHAYALTVADDPVVQRIQKGCDEFHQMYAVTSVQVARQIASDHIDVLVDLGGYTTHTRPEILAMRPAPLQCHFLGYPGTLSLDAVPWMLADSWLVPAAHHGNYSETVLDLPQAFVGSAQAVAQTGATRSECGLPTSGFVYACFNAVYKIDPPLFDCWMRLLQQVKGSVLWLAHAPETVQARLRAEAAHRGVDGGRLVFAVRRSMPEYLASLRHADLFLDTFGYSAGSTAVHAVQAGLPVLTCPGPNNASRMGASIAAAAGLATLICNTPEEYEARALTLAADGAEIKALRQSLQPADGPLPLLDVAHFARGLESAFDAMRAQTLHGA